MHASARIVGDDFVEERISGPAFGAYGVPFLNFKRVVFKRQALHRGVGR
jgi:hypothetical protein